MNKVLKLEHVCDDAPYCGAKRSCPTGAIEYNAEQKRILIDDEKCIGCWACVRTCPRGALKMSE